MTMKIKLTVELPDEAKDWMYAHSGEKGTVASYRRTFDAAIASLIDDIREEYEQQQAERGEK